MQHKEITPEKAKELISYLPQRPDEYDDWIKVIAAVGNTFDEATALDILLSHFRDEEPDQHKNKLKNRLQNISIATLIYYARQHGYTGRLNGKDSCQAYKKRPKPKPRYEIKGDPPLYRSQPPQPEQRVYRMAVNKKVLNKNLSPATREPYQYYHRKDQRWLPSYTALTNNFRNTILSIDELIATIRSGYAILCSQLSDGSNRSSENFKGAELIAVDIDDGLTLDEAMTMDITHRAMLIYTTASHKPDNHRFRIIFDLPVYIKEPELYRAITNNFIQKYNADRNTKDVCRAFYTYDRATIYDMRNGAIYAG